MFRRIPLESVPPARGGRPGGAIAILALLILACGPDAPLGTPLPREASLAKGGGGAGGPLTVTSTSPASAPQDTTLDVVVNGSGFERGAKASWALAGDTTKVHVVATRFVSASQLVATVLVPAGAPVASYDVQVTLSTGKKGVGAELFDVTPGDPRATFSYPLADAGLALASDGHYGDGTWSHYSHGVCGVSSKIFATTAASNSGDATMQTDNPNYRDRKCAAYPRKVTLRFPDAVSETFTVFTNLRQLQNTTYAIAIGATVKRAYGLSGSARCGQLRWGIVGSPNGPAEGDSVLVTRLDASTWQVETQPAPNDQARCYQTGELLTMPVKFRVTSSYPLP